MHVQKCYTHRDIKKEAQPIMSQYKLLEAIDKRKQEKGFLILAHYYVDSAIQQIADFVGDSLFLNKMTSIQKEQNILFCGVKFMGESAKLLNPNKKIIMPDITADCPMVHMIETDEIKKVKSNYDDLAIVCYINSTLETKAFSDVCVTASNAVKVIRQLEQKNIFFIPDKNLGRYIQSQIPDKHFIFSNGFCPVHSRITIEKINTLRKKIPNAEILAHPECPFNILKIADYIGGTSGIIDYANKSKGKQFIICTEMGILYKLKQENPDKDFYFIEEKPICHNMKKINLQKVYNAMYNLKPEIHIDKNLAKNAKKSLDNMYTLSEI